jgi:hypothetical protein
MEEEKRERCRCPRCKNEHDFSERVSIEDGKGIGRALVCPRCLCRSYYDITEYDFQYCTGYPVIDICPRRDKCLLVENKKRDNPSQLSKLRVRHYTKRALKNCKYFIPSA